MERSKELSMDQSFLQSLKEIVFSNLENEQFGAEELSGEIGLSRSQVHRKLQKINGKSITQFIRETRLDVALDLLKKEVGTASEISYKVGFSSPAYFSKCFHEYFGYPPGEAKYRSRTSERRSEESLPSDSSTIIPIHGGKREGSDSDYRKLATIMFSDICGYTAIMEKSEKVALSLLKRNKKLHQSIIELYNGTLIKEIGDAIMASFDSPSDAVHCAQQIISTSKDEENLKLHIGIHLGEVHFIDDDVFGDGVNIASRINSEAKEGEVLISEEVCKNVRNKENIFTEEIGHKKFKNVRDPVRVFKIIDSGIQVDKNIFRIFSLKRQVKATWRWVALILVLGLITIGLTNLYNRLPVDPKDVSAVAIMPFDNKGDAQRYENLRFGLAEGVISNLVRTQNLRVISENASFQFDEKNRSYHEIAKKLHVDHIVEGSFFMINNGIEVNIRLVDASTGQIWDTNKFNCELSRINYMLSEVALNLVESLGVQTSESKREFFTPSSEISFTAYELYVKGRRILRGFNPGDTSKIEPTELAKHSFMAALQIEPNYVDAYIGLAEATWFEFMDADKVIPSEKLPIMKEFVQNGLDIDPNRGELYALKGLISIYDNEWVEGSKLIEKGLALSPNYSFGHLCQAWINSAHKEHEKAVISVGRAVELDPLNRFYKFWNVIMLTFAGHFDRSQALLDIYALDTTLGTWVLWCQGNVFVQQTKMDSAHNLYYNRYSQSNCNWKYYTYGATGEFDSARQILRKMKKKEAESYQNPWSIALTYLGLQEYDSAIIYLGKAYELKSNLGVFLVNSPVFEPLRDNPRFRELMVKMDLAE